MRLNNLNLNRLRTFHVVYQVRGIRRAAERLHLTPAAVSTAVKTLEEELGQTLFARAGHDMVPTRQAEALFATVAQFLGALDETLASFEAEGELEGTLRVGAPNGFGVQQVVPRIASFAELHRGADFVLRLGTPDRLMPLLRSGEIDMAIVPRRGGTWSQASWVAASPLPFDYAPRLVCSAETWARSLKRRRSYARFIALAHVALWNGRQRIVDWYARTFRRKPSVAIALEVDNLFAALAAVERGPWLAVLPDDVVAEPLRQGTLVDLHPKPRQRRESYALLRLAGRPPFALERRFVTHLA